MSSIRQKNFENLREFISALDEAGELRRVVEEVSPVIGVSKITDEESKKPKGGKALFFENVRDGGKQSFPITTNLFGSDKRMAMALGLNSLEEAQKKVEEITQMAPPKSFGDFFETAKKVFPLLKIFPKNFSKNKTPPCQEVVQEGDDINLSEIPVLQCWPKDGGRFVTLPLVFTKSPDGKRRNLGMYRLQIYDKNTTGMHWHIHKDGAHYYKEYSKTKTRMPVAVAIGADPSVIYAATAPMPRDIDEILLAGFLRGKGVSMTKCKTIDMEVPSEAEFVLEGYVDPDELRLEGPFGDHTGYYSPADMYPVFHLTAITRKKNPVYCATLVGPPPMEDCYMAKATERIFLPLLRTVMPEIRDYFLPWEGVFHNIVIVSAKKEYPAHAQKIISGLWGQGQMSFCKCIVVVDEDCDPSDMGKVWQLLKNSFDFKRDAIMSAGVLDVLDHSSPTPLSGAKIGIDLTREMQGESKRKVNLIEEKFPTEKFSELKNRLKNLKQFLNAEYADGFLSVSIEKGQSNGKSILEEISIQTIGFEKYLRACVIFDKDIDIKNSKKMLWKIFNNVDPSRDIIQKDGFILIDACKKNASDGYEREWPDDLRFDDLP